MSGQESDAAVRDVMRALVEYGAEFYWYERSPDDPDTEGNETVCRIAVTERSHNEAPRAWDMIATTLQREWASRIAAYVKHRVYASGTPHAGFYRVRA